MDELQKLQEQISSTFNMYEKPYPVLHLTVGVLGYCHDIERVFPVLEDVFASFRRFNVRVQGNRCFNAPYLSVGVAVDSQPLSFLAGRLEGALYNAGFSPLSFARWDFHISLVSPLFASRQWSIPEFVRACHTVDRCAPSGDCEIQRLELWEPEFPPLTVLAQFMLR